MSDKNNEKSFWSTLPGILTGIAAIITAIGGLIIAINTAGIITIAPETPTPTPAITTPTLTITDTMADKVKTAVKENLTAIIETSMGTMTVELYGDRAPNTTANFIELAESGFYDGLIFHRVKDDFMIQGGDPKGDGTGGSGKTIKLEIHPELTHVDCALAMARSQNPDSASSQFYNICDGAQHFLDGNYAVFGKVVDGMDVVRAIAAVETDPRDRPLEDVAITKISTRK